MEFEILLDGIFDFLKCWYIMIWGYNKVGFYFILFVEIKSCSVFDLVFIKLNIVIDVVGKIDLNIGREFFFLFFMYFLFCIKFINLLMFFKVGYGELVLL